LLLSVYGVAAEQVAFYGIASQFVRDLRTLRRSFGAILSPLAARLHEEGRVDAIAHHLVASSRWSLMLAIPAAIALVAMMSDILKIYHPSFAEPTWFVLVLASRTLVGAAFGLSGNVLMMTGHSKYNLMNSVVSAGLTFGISALLIPQLGLLGAAAATATAETTSTLLALAEIHWLERVRPHLRGLAKPIVAGLTAGGLLVMAWILLDAGASLVVRLCIVAAAVAAFAAALFALGIDEDDRLAVIVAITGKGKERLRQSREDDGITPV
jgi:O-antigen/teichoic acid export membrane protein